MLGSSYGVITVVEVFTCRSGNREVLCDANIFPCPPDPMAEVEKRRGELEAQAQSIQAEIDTRNSALGSANAEYEKLMVCML